MQYSALPLQVDLLTVTHCLEPDLHVIRAPNPSPMTGEGTNTYIIGTGDVCIIDPGPESDAHFQALLNALAQRGRLRKILVTHSHLDHSPLARRLARHSGAPILAYGNSSAGRTDRMNGLADSGQAGGGEGVDHSFHADRTLKDNESIRLGADVLRAIWTPGHFGNHLCFEWRGAVFSGDHVMGWSSTLVSPPDGDMGAYMRSLDRLKAEAPRRLYPGHGAPVDAPRDRIVELRQHRQMREDAILTQLLIGPRTIAQLVAQIYCDTPPSLQPAASRNIFAHLIDLEERGVVKSSPEMSPGAIFSRCERE
ncbi:hydroxyacylglutathione hydrolase [Rhodobaca bogoriensis DSM 18756]|nr:hydroxyacylglutathione hydrolase [Rhodobaca bogoriensis DSM 18756]